MKGSFCAVSNFFASSFLYALLTCNFSALLFAMPMHLCTTLGTGRLLGNFYWTGLLDTNYAF